MKLVIEIYGSEEEILELAGHLSDGGGEAGMQPYVWMASGKGLSLDYVRCFEAWGYRPDLHGKDRRILGVIEENES